MEARAKQLAQWDGQLSRLTHSPDGGKLGGVVGGVVGGGGARASMESLVDSLGVLLREAMAEHSGALTELDARRREMDGIER